MSDIPSSVAPINKLPLELLSDIFVTFAAIVRPTKIRSRHHAINHPAITLLSGVCTRWRQAAFGIPTFWSSIDLRLPEEGYSSQRLQSICLRLERSRNHPLHMRIGKRRAECRLPSINNDISTILRSSAGRLRSLAVTVIYSQPGLVKDILTTLASMDFSGTIRELAISVVSDERPVFSNPDILPQESPNQLFAALTHLYLKGVAFDWGVVYTLCHNLVELQLVNIPYQASPTPSQLFQLLAANRGLRCIRVSGFEIHSYPPPSDDLVIELPELQNLELIIEFKVISWLFARLVTGTQGLSLYMKSSLIRSQVQTQSSAITTSLNSFFQRTRIKSLCISGSWANISSIFTTLQHLEVLRLRGQAFSRLDFDQMDDAARFLPMLHTIDIINCAGAINEIEPGFRSLLSIPSMRHIGMANVYLGEHYVPKEPEPSPDIQLVRQWLAEGGVTASISNTSMSNFDLFNSPFR